MKDTESVPSDNQEPRVKPVKHPTQSKIILGWREWVTFPDFGGVQIRAKVDTGARTSALHAMNLETFKEDGRAMLAFDIFAKSRTAGPVIRCTAPLIARRQIRSSSGHDSYRYIIIANVKIGDFVRPIEISLTQRDRMQHHMLLGRSALADLYMVDPVECYLLGK